MIRLLVSDVDGTLLPYGEREIAAEYLSLLHQLLESGVQVAIASGRSYYNLRTLFAADEARMTFICHDGCLMMRGGRRLYHRPIAPADMTAFARSPRSVNLPLLFAAAERLYVLRPTQSLLDTLAESRADAVCSVHSLLDIREPVYKMAVYRADATPETLDPLPAGLRVCSRGGAWVEYVPRYANKGCALSDLQMRLGYDRYDTAAIGDARNDLEMLRGAKYGCAVPEACGELRQSAPFCLAPDAFFREILQNNMKQNKNL